MIELEELDARTVRVLRTSLSDYLKGLVSASLTFVWKIYRVRSVSFAIQSPWEHRPKLYNISRLGLKGVGRRLCRYHEGPDEKVEEHRYCNRPAVTPNGFCNEHWRSPFAYYERCTTGNWGACYVVDRLWAGEKYAVYLLAFGDNIFKTGMTRAWRIYTRIAEQPHTIAYVVNVYNSIISARQTERKLSRMVGISEGIGVKKETRLSASLKKIVNKAALEEEAKKLAGLVARIAEETNAELFSILPRHPELFANARHVTLSELVGKSFEIIDYWGGYLLVKTSNAYYLIEKREVLHRAINTFELAYDPKQ